MLLIRQAGHGLELYIII
uniref:Uncharacterized protein n=1 Tax=Arundo donax TaxID=35708 RepID=A0A0A9ESF7_ARUDO